MLVVPVATPVTVKVWAVPQLAVVNVSDAGSTVALVSSPLVGVTVTVSVGAVASLTV